MKNIVSKSIPFLLITIGFFTSCASKKDVILFQDIQVSQQNRVNYAFPKIQINDILDIKISALNPETANPYNASIANINALQSLELIKLNGYLVSEKGTVSIPVLGDIVVSGKTKDDLEKAQKNLQQAQKDLKNAQTNLQQKQKDLVKANQDLVISKENLDKAGNAVNQAWQSQQH